MIEQFVGTYVVYLGQCDEVGEGSDPRVTPSLERKKVGVRVKRRGRWAGWVNEEQCK